MTTLLNEYPNKRKERVRLVKKKWIVGTKKGESFWLPPFTSSRQGFIDVRFAYLTEMFASSSTAELIR